MIALLKEKTGSFSAKRWLGIFETSLSKPTQRNDFFLRISEINVFLSIVCKFRERYFLDKTRRLLIVYLIEKKEIQRVWPASFRCGISCFVSYDFFLLSIDFIWNENIFLPLPYINSFKRKGHDIGELYLRFLRISCYLCIQIRKTLFNFLNSWYA